MLKGYRGIVAALAGVALFALLGFGLSEQSRYQHEAKASTAKYAADAAKEMQRACLGVIEKPQKSDCYHNAVNEYRLKTDTDQREHADLIVQQTSAVWTSIMGITALIGMALSVVGVILVWTTFKATKLSNVIAKSAFEYQIRPWVKLSITLRSLIFTETDISLGAIAVSKNVGQSPANRLSIVALILEGVWSSERVFNNMPGFFNEMHEDWQERCLFRNEEWSRGIRTDSLNIVGRYDSACVVIVARYSSPATFNQFHYTARIYDLVNRFDNATIINLKLGNSATHVVERDSFPSYAS